MSERPKVELQGAYSWTCDSCGQENFEHGCTPELTAEDVAELNAEHGIEIDDVGKWMTMPSVVECKGCGEEFDTEDPMIRQDYE